MFDLRDEEHKLTVGRETSDKPLGLDNQWQCKLEILKYASQNGRERLFGKPIIIELNQLSAHSKEVKMKEVKMAPLSLELKDRLRWDYEEEHIRGLLQAKTDWIELAYGGRFVSPVFGLGIDGKSISNFNFAGDLKAGSLGPLDVLGVYQNSATFR